jgi:hypothetical protein
MKTMIHVAGKSVEPAAALCMFIERNCQNPQELLAILEELWRKARDYARRACMYVLSISEQSAYPKEVVNRAQRIMTIVQNEKKRTPHEMVRHVESVLTSIMQQPMHEGKVVVTFSPQTTRKCLHEILSSLYISFCTIDDRNAITRAVISGNWDFIDTCVEMKIKIDAEYQAFTLTSLIVKTADDIELAL